MGFEADADSYEAGISVDDDSWGDGVDSSNSSGSDTSLVWYFLGGLLVLIVAIVFIGTKCGGKSNDDEKAVNHDSQMVKTETSY